LFWDILISFLDTVSDFAQGVVLFSMPEKRLFGIVTLAINWIPGIPAAIHLVSMYRMQFPWYSTLLYAFLLIGNDTNSLFQQNMFYKFKRGSNIHQR
jgi:hypothetical protein